MSSHRMPGVCWKQRVQRDSKSGGCSPVCDSRLDRRSGTVTRTAKQRHRPIRTSGHQDIRKLVLHRLLHHTAQARGHVDDVIGSFLCHTSSTTIVTKNNM